MTDLLLLAERVEGAEALEQRELLEWAWQEIHGWPPAVSRSDDAAHFIRMLDAEAYESAALMLLPVCDTEDGPKPADFILEHVNGGLTVGARVGHNDPDRTSWGATNALALTAACLRARHSMEGLS